jgi:YkoP domain
MPSDAAFSSRPIYDGGPLHADWKDEFWIALVGSLDARLRSYYDIRDFTDDPQCMLRIGPMPAHMPVLLSDGTEIREGELVGALHLWNEHVPRYSGNGPSLAWAKEMRRRVLRSLILLADFVERDPIWAQVRAFCGDSTLSSRIGGLQMQRLARRHGFEPIQPPGTRSRHLHTIADSLIVWGLTRAFNPAALRRQRFLRNHNELWISRSVLVTLYRRDDRSREAA